MTKRRRRMKGKEQRKKNEGFFDFLLELLSWAPEILLLPFRLLLWFLRGIRRWMLDGF